MILGYNDFHWIVDKKVAQGGYPGSDPADIFGKFDVVVYTAEERQPRIAQPKGKLALYAPLDDDVYRPLPMRIGAQLHVLASQCASLVQRGNSVLITCQQGKNRSGLVTGLTLLKLYPSWTPKQAISLIRSRRKLDGDIALSNTMFEQYLLAHGQR